ncbi:MAG: putative toxin-antitoxin system toxin component, PIN family [Syntrophomonadaceae bacterium]|nr:putative toxin-antitoxin system toxin component, PIN family [Syntrophomonadaceae bacterium]
MRAVIDTNVLVSGMLSRKSYPAKALDGWVFNKFKPVVSRDIIKEYSEVLVREKFSVLGSKEKRMEIFKKLLEFSWVTLVHPEEEIGVISEDPKDNMFLECAVAGKASWIVTGDEHLLKLNVFENIKIITSKFFVEEVL